MATRIIGIDFGTSTTVVRIHNVGTGNSIIPLLINGQSVIPTIAFKPEESEDLYYGYDAQAKIDQNAKGDVIRNFKMKLIGNEDSLNQAKVLIDGFMAYVFKHYQSQLNQNAFPPADSIKVYVSHPAKWSSAAISIMKNSVVNAGFCTMENVFAKDEPTAAVLATLHEHSDDLLKEGMIYDGDTHKAMMIDMGAGTTDIVLFCYTVKNGKTEISDVITYPSMGHEGLCGGREIDDALMKAAEAFVHKMTNAPINRKAERALNKLRKRIRVWKEKAVSERLRENNIPISEPEEISDLRDDLLDSGIPIANEGEKFVITREYFQKETQAHWSQWIDLLNGAFKEVVLPQYGNMKCPKRPEEVELLIITGGHSQWYIVDDYILSSGIQFQKIKARPNLLVHSDSPQETVAIGLCYLDEDVVKCHPVPNDVDVSFTCEGQYLGATNLVKKGTPLPYEKNDIVLKNVIKGNFIRRKALLIKYVVTTDSKNRITREVFVEAENMLETIINVVLAAIGVGILDIPKIWWNIVTFQWDKINPEVLNSVIDYNYDVVLKPQINVNEEGIIKVGGKLSIGSKELDIPEIII